MPQLREIAHKIRSKNAGPFSATIDIFCSTQSEFDRVCRCVSDDCIAALYGVDRHSLRRFEIPNLRVLKFSFPRPTVQGSRQDRDMHAAQLAESLLELELVEK